MKRLIPDKCDNQIIFIIPTGLVITFGIINLVFIIHGMPFTSLNLPEKFGFDFRDFHWAARLFIDGTAPWQWDRFVAPPLSVLLALPFASLHPVKAIQIFFTLNVMAILGGLVLYTKSFLLESPKFVFFSMGLSCLFSFPVIFLLQRGNIDGIVFFLLALGVFCAAKGSDWKKDLFSGLAFSAAIHLKIYPVLIYLPILAFRRWRLAIVTTVFLGFIGMMTLSMWDDFFIKLSLRQDLYSPRENGSLAHSLMPFIVFALRFLSVSPPAGGLKSIENISYVIYAILLVSVFLADVRRARFGQSRDFAVSAMMYVPFMVTIPATTFLYEFVHLMCFIPLIAWMDEQIPWSRPYLAWLAGGVILSQTQSTALFIASGNLLADYIPGIGALFIMLFSVFMTYKLQYNDPSRYKSGDSH
jgi:hypothetical protein